MSKNLSNLLVIDGGSVKTSEEGIVDGLGIVFGSEKEPDQSQMRDFFTADSFVRKSTSFTVPLYYNHGLGPINTEIGEATLTKSEEGWLVSGNIDLEDELGKKVYEAVKSTPHGFSTGALQHLVKREPKGNNTNFLRQWVVGEISLTERPAERKAVVHTVKSIDGEVISEPAWEPDYTITFYDKDKNAIWDNSKSVEELEGLTPHSVKYIFGSTTYSFYAYDEETGVGIDAYVAETGSPEEVLRKIQTLLATAKAMDGENMTMEMSMEELESKIAEMIERMLSEKFSKNQSALSNKEAKEVDHEALRKECMDGCGDDEECKKKCKEKHEMKYLQDSVEKLNNELADLRDQLSNSEDALTKANEQIARLEILAGAKETIDNKGK